MKNLFKMVTLTTELPAPADNFDVENNWMGYKS